MNRVEFQGQRYDRLILLRLGEITLKGLNRRRFVDRILKTLRYRLRPICAVEVYQEHSRIWVRGLEEHFPIDEILTAIKPVFGYVSASPVRVMPSDPQKIREEVLDYAARAFAAAGPAPHTFKMSAMRTDKSYPENSYELCVRLGELVLKAHPGELSVDLHQPDVNLTIEVREQGKSYLYHKSFPAYRGLPVGMSGRGMLLLSGGIDSPVAGFQMASRGMQLSAVYFHTHPYTSPEAKQKVVDLARILASYAGRVKLNVVDFTPVQLALNESVDPELLTVVMRRMMYRIAAALAERHGCGALISGESLGQVASQTLEALQCIDYLMDLPLFRPLIGMDKDEIIRISREIGAFDTSILPYEDCCTVFVAKHPKTKPKRSDCERAEAKLPIEELVKEAVESCELYDLNPL